MAGAPDTAELASRAGQPREEKVPASLTPCSLLLECGDTSYSQIVDHARRGRVCPE